MKRMLFNATYAEELRVAAVEGQKLINFDIETSSKEQRRGNIYKGFITRVEPSLEACFVDYGTEKQGFLPFKEIDFRYLPELNGQKTREFSKLQVGAELIVQVEKDERGNKGAALTSYVTLPGRYLVLMPNNSRAGGISRRIEGEERDELKSLMSQLDVPQGMSVILRTAALGRVIEELQWDLTYLLKLWSAIKSAAVDQKGSFLIYQESSLVIRSIRDHFSPDISEILIDTEAVYTQARQFMAHVMPNFADRIKLYRDDVPLFSRFQIEHQIESAYSRTVNLPSGGAIVIDHTEALTSVDVNSAKANKGADIETTAFLTNIEAAEEIARQLRLRDLGGLVVVDYIDMENQRNQRDLENHFKLQLGLDRARIQMGKLSKFGLLELSRQRLQTSLDESSTIACPRCAGVGSIRGIESSALHVLRIVQEEAVKNGSFLSALYVQLPVDVATYLLNERRDDVAKIEVRMKVKIMLIPNVHLDSPNYKIKKISFDSYESNLNKSSYNLVELPDDSLSDKASPRRLEASANKQPLVQNIGPNNPAPVIEPRKATSLFSGIVKKIGELFVSKAEPEIIPKAPPAINSGNRNFKQRNFDNNQRHTERSGRNPQQVREVREPTPPPPHNLLAANKTRPVNVSKSNNRIQTVRPTPVVGAAINPKPVSPVPAPRGERVVAQARNGNNPASPSVVNTIPVPRNNDRNIKNVVAAQPARKATTGSNHAGFEDKLNIASQTPEEQVIFVSSSSGAAVKTVIKNSLSLPTKDLGQTEAQMQPVNSHLNLHKSQVRLEVADLGNLQLVATKPELLNQAPPEILLKSGKRFCDIVIEEKLIDPNLQYELVETKH